jgi:hypothetical protein
MRGGLGIRSSSSMAQVGSFALLIRGYGSLSKSTHSCVGCAQKGEAPFRMQVRSNRDVSHTSRPDTAIWHEATNLQVQSAFVCADLIVRTTVDLSCIQDSPKDEGTLVGPFHGLDRLEVRQYPRLYYQTKRMTRRTAQARAPLCAKDKGVAARMQCMGEIELGVGSDGSTIRWLIARKNGLLSPARSFRFERSAPVSCRNSARDAVRD